jgi:hypothetical protein
MAKNRFEDDLMENETAVPDPPEGTPTEVAKRAWQIAWSASNAAAGYHASIINHLIAHEKKIVGELSQMRVDLARDFASFRSTLIVSLQSVGIRIDLSPSGEHAAVHIAKSDADNGTGRERVASSHDLQEGLAEVSERIEEELDDRLRKIPGGIPSERIREMLTQERAHVESEQKIMRLELEKSQIELAHVNDIKRLTDQRTDLAEANARWLRVAFMIVSGIVTVLAGILIWKLTEGRGKLPG